MAGLPLLLLFAGTAISAPYIADLDSAETVSYFYDCSEGASRLSRRGTTVFNYEGETENAVVGTSSSSTGMKMTATVYLQPTENCMFSMQISESKLLIKSKNSPDFVKADESKKFSRELSAQELFFRMSGGKVTELFPSSREKPHVLNIKRGILSTLQLGDPTKDSQETDVNGICRVEYETAERRITKTKRLSECSERTHTELGIQSGSFEQDNLPINPLNSTSSCTYQLGKSSEIESVKCREMHIFRPFSAGYKSPSGAITTVNQKLELVTVKFGRPKQSIFNKNTDVNGVSLLFDHSHEEMKPASSIIDQVDKIMNVLVDKRNKLNLAVKQNYAHEFTELVTLLRQLDRKRMMPVWEKYFDCTRSRICGPNDDDLKELYRQYLLDALTYCGTSTCVFVVHNVIVDESVTGEKVNMFLQGIALVAKPTKNMVRDIMNIASTKPSRQAYMTLGTLLSRFCKANPEECVYGKTNPITQAELFIEGKLGRECEGQQNSERVEELLGALKAIGNSGRPSHAWSTLAKCARMSLHQNVSIAALEAMRLMPCDKRRMQELYEMLGNVEMDPERRIHVFLAIMKCPTKASLAQVVDQLAVEQSRQVGSFMWSHLTNLNESSNPCETELRENLREILKGKALKKFDLDRTKYSRSWEGSVYSGILKSGLKSDGHLIFHPESYLPRSALLNLTAHVMGVPLNILEMALRVEGLETIVGDVFGPNGMLPDNSILKFFNITITKEDIDRAERARSRRDVDSTMEENIADIHARVNKRRIQPSGHLSVKMFGQDVRLFSYDDIFWMIDQVDNMNVIELLLKLAKGGHKTFTKSFMFLEIAQTVPTGLGIPLKLKLVGSAVASLELDGKFDIRNMFWGPSQMELKGFVRPSAVAEISGQMGIESHFVRSGMFVNSSVYTSQILKGGVLYKEGRLLKVNVDAPEEPITIFNVSTSPFLYLNGERELLKGIARRISPEFCINATVLTGLGVCTSFAVPVGFREYEAPYFPLSGPAHFGVKLIKTDEKLTTYEVKMKIDKQEYTAFERKECIGTFEMGTPGATHSPRVSGMVRYVENANSKTLTLGSFEAKKKVEFMVSYHNDTNRFEVDFRTNLVTKELIALKFLYFNDTSMVNRHVGLLLRAKYGDLYKAQQVWKVVKGPTSFKLFSRTTYYPGKHLTGEIDVIPGQRSVNVRFDANQFNQTVDLMGKVLNTPVLKGLNFTAMHLSSKLQGSVFAGFVNEEYSKRFLINGTFNGKYAELSLGYLKFEDGHELKASAIAAGKQVEVFANYSSYKTEDDDDISEALVGGRYESKVVGGRVYFLKSKDGTYTSLCTTAFVNHEEPASVCLSLESDLEQEGTYRRVGLTGRILEKKVGVEVEYERNSGDYAFNTTLLYNERAFAQNSWLLTYDGLLNTELKVITKIGKRSAVARVYSVSDDDNAVVFGVEGKALNHTAAVTATYTTEYKGNTALYGVLVEAHFNKKLPFSYRITVENGDISRGISSVLQVMKYTLKSSTHWIRPAGHHYQLLWNTVFSHDNLVVLGFKDSGLLVFDNDAKSFTQTWTITVAGKEFEYGWNILYKNLDTGSIDMKQVTLGLKYARGKTMMLTTTLFNKVDKAGMIMDFNYLPKRQVRHIVEYFKNERRVNVDIEFLPRMFIRFMARLDKVDGWKLTTNLRFDWKRMNRLLKWVAAYKKTTEVSGLSFEFGTGRFQVRGEGVYNQRSRTMTFAIVGFGKTMKLVGVHNEQQGSVSLRLVTETQEVARVWLELKAGLKNGEASIELKSSRSLLRMVTLYRKEENLVEASMFGLGKQLLRLQGQYKRETTSLHGSLFVYSRERLRVVAKLNRAERAVFLHFDAIKKNWNVGFIGKYDPRKMTVTLSVEALQKVMGIALRADCRELIIGADAFYQDQTVGWYALVDTAKKAVVYNVTFTPRLSGQFVAEAVDDRILKFTTQRKIGDKVVNETSFSYDLMADRSNLIFQWNTKTMNTVKSFLSSIVKEGYRNVSLLSEQLEEIATKFGDISKAKTLSVYRNVSTVVLRFVRELENGFEKIDFNKAKNTIRQTLLDAFNQVSTLSTNSLRSLRELSLKVRDEVPEYTEKLRKYKEQAKVFWRLSSRIGVKVANNLTDSVKPVLKTALKLAKEFKIRGKTIEEVVEVVVKYVDQKVKLIARQIREKAKTTVPEIVSFIKLTNVPYLDTNVEQLFIKGESRLRQATFNYDVKKTTEWLKREAMEMKIQGKNLQQHIQLLQAELKKLPKVLKSTMLTSLETSKEYVQAANMVIMHVKAFLQPMTNFLKNVNVSVYKHYGPLVNKVYSQVAGRVSHVYAPLEKAVTRYVEKVTKFVLPLAKPVKFVLKDWEQQLRDLTIFEKKLVETVEQYLKKMSSKALVKMQHVKAMTTEVMEKAQTVLQRVSRSSTDELVDLVYEITGVMIQDALEKVRGYYHEREMMARKIYNTAMKYYEDSAAFSKRLCNYSLDEIIEDGLIKSGDVITMMSTEIASTVDQMSRFDLGNPLLKAWKETDLVGQLEKYGVSGKVAAYVLQAKKVNVSDLVFSTVQKMRHILLTLYSRAAKQALKYSETATGMVQYMMAVPKKDFKEFAADVEIFIQRSRDQLMKSVKKNYVVTYDRISKWASVAKALYDDYYIMYLEPAEYWYGLIKEKTMCIYEDNKQEGLKVYEHYKDFVTLIFERKLTKTRNELVKKYNEMYLMMEKLFDKYADLTWEEMGQNVYREVISAYNTVHRMTEKRVAKLTTLIEKVKGECKKMCKDASFVVGKYKRMFIKDIMPKLEKLYREYRALATTHLLKVKKIAVEFYTDASRRAAQLYGDNKRKTIEQLYNEITASAINTYSTFSAKTAKELQVQYRRAYVVVKDILLPELKKEMESIFNQTLRASVVLANTTVDCFIPHYRIVKKNVEDAVTYGRVHGKELVEVSKQKLQAQVKRLVKYIEDLLEKIVRSPIYQEYKTRFLEHKIVKMSAKKYKELKPKVEAKYYELLGLAKDLMESERVLQMIQRVRGFVKSIDTSRLEQVYQSVKYTAEQLKPRVNSLLESTKETASKVPGMVKRRAEFFVQNPEECFWKTYGELLALGKTVRNVDYRQRLEETKGDLLALAFEVTDIETKEAALEAMETISRQYEQIKEVPKMLKEKYTKVIAEYKKKVQEIVQSLRNGWDRCPYKTIVEHEIWMEIVEEVRSHELVAEVSHLAKKLTQMAKTTSRMIASKVLDYGKTLKTELVAKRTRIQAKVTREYFRAVLALRKFVKETTVEDIVNYVMLSAQRTKSLLLGKKRTMELLLKNWYLESSAKVVRYYAKALAQSRVYHSLAMKEWKKYEPKVKYSYEKVVTTVKAHLKTSEKLLREAQVKAKRELLKIAEEARRMWVNSKITENFNAFKTMTIRETVVEIKGLPMKAASVYNIYKLKLMEKAELYGDLIKQYTKPYVRMVDAPLRWIGNEINETAVFIYRYYGLREKASNLRYYVESKGRVYIPRVSAAVKESVFESGMSLLKTVHSSLVYVDKIDIKKAEALMKSYVEKLPDIKAKVKAYFAKYVTVRPEQGLVLLSIPHYSPVEPSFSYQLNKINRTVRLVANRTMETAKRLVETMKNKTFELRRDLNNSYLVHRLLVLKGWSIANRYGAAFADKATTFGAKVLMQSRTRAEKMWSDVEEWSGELFVSASNAAMDVYTSKNTKEAFGKLESYGKNIVSFSKASLERHLKQLSKTSEKFYKRTQDEYRRISTDMRPYYSLLKIAVQDWIKGREYSLAFQHVRAQMRKTYRYMMTASQKKLNEILSTIAIDDPELVQVLQQYKAVHREIFGKYFRRLHRIYKLAKVAVDRTIRIIKKEIGEKASKPLSPLKMTAKIFGKAHVMTFDRKFYEFPTYNKKTCTYLLARDFYSGNFTLLSQAEHLIVITPEMQVTIHQNGEVNSVVKAGKYETRVPGLPVQSSTGKCLRDGAFVKCTFNQGIDITCDIEHFDCTLELSGRHYGKSEGLLGTNNNEVYDDFKVPAGSIADSVYEFADSWEVSGDPECSSVKESLPTVCNEAPSPKCREIFGGKTSPFAKYFSVVDPEPFLKACEVDSVSCDSKDDMFTISHCNASAAYVNLLKADGYRVKYLPECAFFKSSSEIHLERKQWTEAPRKAADIVVLVSERETVSATKTVMSSVVYSLYKRLGKLGYNTRFALIGFGGSNIHEDAHVHTVAGQVFMDEAAVTTTMKSMPYTGSSKDTNDAYAALRLASTLKFRPEASRIIVLFNAGEFKSHKYGPTIDETMYALKYEANASLFAFDKVNFKNVGKGRLIGQTARRMYVVPNFRALPVTSLTFPDGVFSSLVHETDGGLFANKMKPKHMKAIATGLADAVTFTLRSTSQSCRSCFLNPGNAGEARFICRSNNKITC